MYKRAIFRVFKKKMKGVATECKENNESLEVYLKRKYPAIKDNSQVAAMV